MTDDLGTRELSSPAANGATGDSVSALSVGSYGAAACDYRRMVMAKSGKSTLKPLLVLIAASAVMWVAGMAIHSF